MREIVKARPLEILDGWLICEFDNGEKRLVDIKPSMKGVLEKLHDPEEFYNVDVDEEAGTVVWPEDCILTQIRFIIAVLGVKEAENLGKALNDMQRSGDSKNIV